MSASPGSPRTAASSATATARLLSLSGVVAAALFIVVSLSQAALRPGFDLTRHAVSQLAVGSGGEVQTANFVVTGVLMLVCATALHRGLQGGPGHRWAPVLVAVQGIGLVAAAVFPADPGNGFPPETAGRPPEFSTGGVLHLASAGIAFLALAAACFVLARRFSRAGEHGWAVAGRVGGVALLLGFGYANSGAEGGTLGMFVGVVAAWLWVGASAARLAGPGE